jgi:tetratricopeptide (TPR) repeat protein
MKNFVLFLSFLVLGLSQAQAQDEGAKLAKKAAKDLVSYNIDPAGNKAKLQESKEKIDQAMKLADAQAIGSAWQTQGNIYSTIAQQAVAMRAIGKDVKLPEENYALTAFDAFKKAYAMSEKKYEKKDALAGIKEVENNLNIFGTDAYERKDFKVSYASFAATLETSAMLKAAGELSIYEKLESQQTQQFLTGLTARLAGKDDVALPIFEKLVAQEYKEASIYQGLHSIKMANGDEAGALAVLSQGRKLFPEDSGLLFDEINAYLKQGKLNELIANLETAIKKEPNNVTLYVTKGNVYENLCAKATTDKDATKAAEYESKAVEAYNQALEKDPKNATAVYSLGAISFNKAAAITQEMNVLSEKNGSTAQLEKLGDQVKVLFDAALPYFKKAEALDPNNENALIALREIHARRDELDIASECSKRIKVLQAGGKNETSIFKL